MSCIKRGMAAMLSGPMPWGMTGQGHQPFLRGGNPVCCVSSVPLRGA